jgi:hypothetical protein
MTKAKDRDEDGFLQDDRDADARLEEARENETDEQREAREALENYDPLAPVAHAKGPTGEDVDIAISQAQLNENAAALGEEAPDAVED